MGFLKKMFGKPASKTVHQFDAALEPETPFYVIGDIHGCEDLLEQLLNKIAEDNPLDAKAKIICVGDYIDRGEASAQVLRWVHSLSQDSAYDVTCLMGNHEDMLLKFLEDPTERGARWIRYGGLQTLASFGVGRIKDANSKKALIAARDGLQEAMGPDLINWLKALPLSIQNGNVAVVHAAADPALPIPEQHDRVLMWGHKDFMKQSREDGVWIVHGHTIVDQAHSEAGRVAVDTGAFATGRLTAVCIELNSVRYLQS